ncbi:MULTISPECIES: LysR family transcriptional regulator [unclassified Vibrio]|uniref:LysR family transcriptional regulator n=1 Tax=Vibrio sp. HB236076 TaxID=3232307 RepID=A0AB39HIT3_9VIBR|nr:LysR family transcriptional regulator [Vibrio sp. HB161653]MDP5252780.1 LysR family transcriptional regulator [Vibrio sp. HB161653]
MNLKRFVTFKTIVEEGSFLKAAQKLYCTQSTVTFQIKQLEQDLSLQLFEKIGRKMVLTQAGKKILPHVYELTRVMDNIEGTAQQENSEPSGELTVLIAETQLAYKMANVLKAFRQKAPKVKLSLQSQNCYKIRDELIADKADLGVFYHVGNEEALKVHEFRPEPMVLVTSPLLSDFNVQQPDQHIEVSFISNGPQCLFRQSFERIMQERNIHIDNMIELSSINTIKHCVESDIGITYLPRFTVETELQAGSLQAIELTEAPQMIYPRCGYHAGKCMTPAMQVFIDCMYSEYQHIDSTQG